MTSWNKLAQKLRVPVGTVLGLLFLLLMHPSERSLIIGGAITLPGCLLRLWAAGHLVKGRVLTQSGPYAFTRNPLYLGSFFMALGIIIAGQSYWLLPAFALFFAIIYFPVMKAEEQELLGGYGDLFIEYSRRVPLFLPVFRKSGFHSSSFKWDRMLRNREHRNLAGLAVAEAILLLQFFFRPVFVKILLSLF
jgi:protein-S-isoprenylcysteine O-methyltransferase Ste14